MSQTEIKEIDQSSSPNVINRDIIFQLFYEQMKDETYEQIIDFDDCSY
jgi:hypothetical protein